MGGRRRSQLGVWPQTSRPEWEAASPLQRSRGCALVVSHEGLDPATGATRSVLLYAWTRPGTDGFLGHQRCQGACGGLTTHPAEFLIRAAPLLADEGRHNLILGIANTLVSRPELFADSRLFVVGDGEVTQAAALITAPYNLVVADAESEAAIRELVNNAVSFGCG